MARAARRRLRVASADRKGIVNLLRIVCDKLGEMRSAIGALCEFLRGCTSGRKAQPRKERAALDMLLPGADSLISKNDLGWYHDSQRVSQKAGEGPATLTQALKLRE